MTTVSTQAACSYCGALFHTGLCPRIEEIEYYPYGAIKSVKLRPLVNTVSTDTNMTVNAVTATSVVPTVSSFLDDDPYTMEIQLCDNNGMVSHEPVEKRFEHAFDESYLGRLNRLRRMGAKEESVEPVLEPFPCTGHAHLIGEHIRCTSPAHMVHLSYACS